ncbi:hypothetical protein Goari_019399 [Gossypium aridum]|uniref:Uncharacterized protein n=2 Tax=Gossypium TaxID=3633 RepID=A0A7J8WSW7_GOSAI|nr:hypothetical protein [Gossypium aridum]
MAMIYTLVTSAKEWLSERYGQDDDADNVEEEESTKDEDCEFRKESAKIPKIYYAGLQYSQTFGQSSEQRNFVLIMITNQNAEHYVYLIPGMSLHGKNYLTFSTLQVIIPHGEPVTVDTFLAWRERFEAELALERAKLMPESALTAPKEKKLSGRQWFESGRATAVTYLYFLIFPLHDIEDLLYLYHCQFLTMGAARVNEESDEEDEEDIDFDDDDFEDDEEDMLEHYLAEKSDLSTHS